MCYKKICFLKHLPCVSTSQLVLFILVSAGYICTKALLSPSSTQKHHQILENTALKGQFCRSLSGVSLPPLNTDSTSQGRRWEQKSYLLPAICLRCPKSHQAAAIQAWPLLLSCLLIKGVVLCSCGLSSAEVLS